MDGPLPLRISGAENPIVPPMHPLYMLSLLADSPKSMILAVPLPETMIIVRLKVVVDDATVVEIVHHVKDILEYGFALFIGRCRCQIVPQICPVDVFHDNGRTGWGILLEAGDTDNTRRA